MSGSQLISVKLPRAMYREVMRAALRQNKSQSSIIREAVAEYLDAHMGVAVSPVLTRGGWRERKGG